MLDASRMKDRCSLTLTRKSSAESGVKVGGRFIIECFDKHGKFKWRQTCPNIVVNVGLQHLLDVSMSGSSQTTAPKVPIITPQSPVVPAIATIGPYDWCDFSNSDVWLEAAREEKTIQKPYKALTYHNGSDKPSGEITTFWT